MSPIHQKIKTSINYSFKTGKIFFCTKTHHGRFSQWNVVSTMGWQTIYKIAKGACIVLQAKGIKNASLQVRFKKRWLVLSLREYVLSLREYVLSL
jgi:hypothetical protein